MLKFNLNKLLPISNGQGIIELGNLQKVIDSNLYEIILSRKISIELRIGTTILIVMLYLSANLPRA